MGQPVQPGSASNFFSAIVLLVLSLFVLQHSADIYAGAGVPFKVSPALLPLFLGCCLLLCSSILLFRTLRQSRAGELAVAVAALVKQWFQSEESDWRRVFGGIALLGVYIFILIPTFEFWLSTSLFLITVYLFLKAAPFWKIGIITLGTVGGIILLFQKVFNVNLP